MINDVFKALKPEQQRTLLHAFENDLPAVVDLDNGNIIGVNLDPAKNPQLKILETAGTWSTGKKLCGPSV